MHRTSFINWHGDTTVASTRPEDLCNVASPFQFVTDMEEEWKKTLPNYSPKELLEIFPEAKKLIHRNLKAEIKKCEDDIRYADNLEYQYDRILAWCNDFDKEFWKAVCNVLYLNPLREGREATIKRNYFLLRPTSGAPANGGVNEEMIARAKQVPMDTLIKVHNKKALCPFHNDSDPSLQIKDNRFYCFVCVKGGDTIDLIRHTHNMSFIDAVKYLAK